MLGTFWLFISVTLFLLSLILHQVPLFLLALLFFFVGGVARLWGRYCLSRVRYQRRLSAERVFFGEEVHLEIDVANEKPLPLPWLHISDEIPESLNFLKAKTFKSHNANRAMLNNLLSLGWYHRIRRRYTIQCNQRGFFLFGPAVLRSGDLFGFFNKEIELPKLERLIVYPKVVPAEESNIPSSQPLGDILTRNHLFQDPILTRGTMEYQPGDSLRRIHWKSTARLGKLQSKVFELTTTVDMCIFLDVRTMPPPYWGIVPELLELAVITAASLAKHTLEKGFRVGLYVNQGRISSEGTMRLPPSQHNNQLMDILEMLAEVHATETQPIADFLLRESRNLPWGSTVLVVSATPTDSLLSALTQLKRVGRKAALLVVGGSTGAQSGNGLKIYRVREEMDWTAIQSITIEAI